MFDYKTYTSPFLIKNTITNIDLKISHFKINQSDASYLQNKYGSYLSNLKMKLYEANKWYVLRSILPYFMIIVLLIWFTLFIVSLAQHEVGSNWMIVFDCLLGFFAILSLIIIIISSSQIKKLVMTTESYETLAEIKNDLESLINNKSELNEIINSNHISHNKNIKEIYSTKLFAKQLTNYVKEIYLYDKIILNS